MSPKATILALFAVLSPLTALRAQAIQVPDSLNTGATITVEVVDPSRCGETITVTVDNGMRNSPSYQEESVTIEIGPDGRGSASWTVPSWFGANFNAPGMNEVSRPVS